MGDSARALEEGSYRARAVIDAQTQPTIGAAQNRRER